LEKSGREGRHRKRKLQYSALLPFLPTQNPRRRNGYSSKILAPGGHLPQLQSLQSQRTPKVVDTERNTGVGAGRRAVGIPGIGTSQAEAVGAQKGRALHPLFEAIAQGIIDARPRPRKPCFRKHYRKQIMQSFLTTRRILRGLWMRMQTLALYCSK
jgi:hypothetical protein